MAKPFRIAMIPGSTDGVNYYRLASWAFEMRKYRNVVVDLPWFKYEIDPRGPHPWQQDFRSTAPSGDWPGASVSDFIKFALDRTCELADVVVWHPVFYDYILDYWLELQHKHQKPFVIETDDNFTDVPVWNEAGRQFMQGQGPRRVALDCIRNADALIASTPHLAETYAKFNDKIHIVQNSLDFKGDRKFIGWDKVSVKKHQGIRIGWIGGRTHYDDIMMVAPVLRKILEANPEVKLVLVNSALERSCNALGRPYPFAGLKNVLIADRSVPINRYAPFMASFGFDIGIAPLVDHNFNRSKSNLRWLEYSALGIPAVCSKLDHYARTVNHGVDGLLASNLDEWEQHLNALIQSEALRENIGRNAAKRVRRDFNVKRNASSYLRILKDIAGRSSVFSDTPAKEMVAA